MTFNQICDYHYPFSPDLMPFWHVMAFIIGTCIGSFLNVCIWRIPRGESIISPPSRCPKCGHEITWYENIPLLSWLFLGGKCSACKNLISGRYFLVELLTGIMFYLLWFKVTWSGQPLFLVPVYFWVAMLVIVTGFIDAEHYLIPNKITYSGAVFGLLAALAFPGLWGMSFRLAALGASLLSMLIAGGIMALFALAGRAIFKREALGWGDVKFIAAIGACLGLKACFFSVLVGSFAGALTGLALILVKKGHLGSAIPFGPFLAAGVYLWMLYGEWLF